MRERQRPRLKTFKDYEPGFLHMAIKDLPQMPDESKRRYLFVAIDRYTVDVTQDYPISGSWHGLNRL